MAKFLGSQTLTSGVPFGGLGTGTIELRPDGEFHQWQIANVEQWAIDSRENPKADDGSNLSGSLSFYIRSQPDDPSQQVQVRRLGLGMGSKHGTQEYNYRMFSWMKPVEEIRYAGEFPTATLEYLDSTFPLDITLKAASPFVPHDYQKAGTPGFYLTFTVTNPSDTTISTSLGAKLRNPVQSLQKEKQRTNRIHQQDDTTFLIMETAVPCLKQADNGSVCLSIQGGDHTYLAGDYGGYMNQYLAYSKFGVSEESYLFHFQRHGSLNNSTTSEELHVEVPAALKELQELPDASLDAMLAQFQGQAFAQDLLERVLQVLPDLLETRQGKEDALVYLRDAQRSLRMRAEPWGDGALNTTFTLAPGESKDIRFVFSWHFPNHYSLLGPRLGHQYETYYQNALESNQYLIQHQEDTLEQVYALRDAFFGTSFDPTYADAWSIQLSNLIKSSWWTLDGSFGMWEGLGSCGFHTTDITYHGSFGILALFPQLQQRQMEMGAKFQREDGRVHHFFTPDFSLVDDGFDRVDMNSQFVLLVCRDYLATGDLAYVQRLWKHIVKAMDNLQLLDQDNDGLPDTDTKRNTYDAWNFSGVSAYISSLWLAALQAAIRLGNALSDTEKVAQWEELLEKGTAAFDKILWNGNYYSLWADGDKRDECCMTNQIDGEWYSRLIGLGGFLPDEKVKKALQTIFQYNYSSESGLINAAYPPGAVPTIHTFWNCQAIANWTGIEYAMSSFYQLMGMPEEALTIVQTVDERFRRLGVPWNHSECGDHYYRPQSSWALIPALSGLQIAVASATLSLSKGEEPFTAPWFGGTAWGTLDYTGSAYTLRCEQGSVSLQSLLLSDCTLAAFQLGEQDIPIISEETGTQISYTLATEVTLTKGDIITLQLG